MSDLRELYQEVILDHNKRPRNFRPLANATRTASGCNPLCGDQLTVYLHMEDEVIQDMSFQGSGCAISKASASMMTDGLKGKTTADAIALFEKVHMMLTGERDAQADIEELGKLVVLSGVCEFPTRVKCATLAWHTLHAALHEEKQAVSTE
jgi:nitrogen fixation NifU-like protein